MKRIRDIKRVVGELINNSATYSSYQIKQYLDSIKKYNIIMKAAINGKLGGKQKMDRLNYE